MMVLYISNPCRPYPDRKTKKEHKVILSYNNNAIFKILVDFCYTTEILSW